MDHHTSDEVKSLMQMQASNASTVWTVATFGAIAEFHGDHKFDLTVQQDVNTLTILSDQGGVRAHLDPDMRAIAYEGLSKMPDIWSQGISVCLPESHAEMSNNTVVTALGRDDHALRPESQGHALYDLGLAAPHMDACVRTNDPHLVDLFQQHCGRTLFADCPDLISAIKDASPDRVFRSALARVEVSTPIPEPDAETSHGAHTHVLPELLSHGRTHAATVPVPHGWLPVLNLFPANPARDDHGNPCAFNAAHHETFQEIMDMFGDRDVVTLKKSIIDAIRDGQEAGAVALPHSRTLRTALRVALRQARLTQGPSKTLDTWVEKFEINSPDDD